MLWVDPNLMRASEYPGLTRVQERKLKIAVEGTCELCTEYFVLPFLEIHKISRRLYREMVRDPSTRILIVCGPCHEHIHRLPVPIKNQRIIVARRSFYIRQDVRAVLGYKPKPYVPPQNASMSEMYEEYFYHYPPGSFRLSG